MLPVSAAATQGRITGEGVALRDKPTTQGSNVILRFSKGTLVTVNGKTTGNEAVAGGGTTWYYVTYSGKTGYVYGKYVEEITEPAYNADFEKNLLSFPESYRAALRTIHNSYPNWVFVADNIGIGLDGAVNLEYGGDNMFATKKWVELTYGAQWRDPRVDETNPDHLREGGRWTFASREAIAYFMDPRNALTVTNTQPSLPNIFTFLQQSYNSAIQTEAGLRSVVAGTFLANGYGGNKDAYIADIMQAAKESNVSPYVIASTIIIEQGTKGTSSLISGTYKGYEGYYNFFNYGASGNNVVVNGLTYAKNKGWNSRRASIVGGAKLYAEGYVSKGQDTYYYMDFNVKSGGNHQYAACLYDQCTKSISMRSVCISNANAALTFKIPVYSAMPAVAYPVPTAHTCVGELRNAKPATCMSDGYSGDTYCKTCGRLMLAGTVIKSTGHTPDEPVNRVDATCLEEGYSGDIYCKDCGELIAEGSVTAAKGHTPGEWIIDIPADTDTDGLWHLECAACGATVKTQEIPACGQKLPGDINGDESVDNKDLTRLFQFLSNWDVTVNYPAVDVNNDGFIDNKDLTRLFQYLSGWDVALS